MTPAAFLDGAARWGLAPGFHRDRDGRWPSVVHGDDVVDGSARSDEDGGRA